MQLLARWTRASALAAVALAVAACGDDPASRVGAPEDARQARTPTIAAPSILVGADSNPVTIARGATASIGVRAFRIGGFTGPITLSVDTAGLARGLRVSLANATIAAGDTSARMLMITADTSAAVTTTAATFRVSASGAGATTQTLLMQVNVVNAIPGFTLGLVGTTSGSMVQVGQSGTVRLVVRRTGGFTGPITFTADSLGLPRGVTVTQGATVGDTVTLNIAAASTAQAGNFTLSLRGAGTGVTAQTIPLALMVQPIGGFTIGMGTTPMTVTGQPGQTITVPVRIARTGGFGGRLGFMTGALPSGLTATFDTTATTATSDTIVNLRLTIPAGIAAGTYPITVRGMTAGLAEQTTTINVTVPQAAFGFGVQSAPFVVLAGATNTLPLTITRGTGFTDSVTFAVTGAPAGLSVGASGIGAGTGTTSTATLIASSTLAPGTYPITVTATGANGQQQTFTTSVVVVGSNNTSFGFRFNTPTQRVNVPIGGSVTVPINVERIARLAPYAVIVPQNVPSGLSVSLDRTMVMESAMVNVTISAPAGAMAGQTYQFSIGGATPIGQIPPVAILVTVTPGASMIAGVGATR